MPKEVILEDGSKLEVPTEEEMTAFQTQSEALKKAQEDINTLNSQVEEYKNQPGGEGIRNLREALKSAKTALKAKNMEFDEETGQVKDLTSPPPLTTEDIQKTAAQVFEKQEVNKFIQSKISSLDADSQEVFKKSFETLTGGRDIALAEVEGIYNATLAYSGIKTEASEDNKISPNIDTMGGSNLPPQPKKTEDLQKGADLAAAMGYQPKNTVEDLIK